MVASFVPHEFSDYFNSLGAAALLAVSARHDQMAYAKFAPFDTATS